MAQALSGYFSKVAKEVRAVAEQTKWDLWWQRRPLHATTTATTTAGEGPSSTTPLTRSSAQPNHTLALSSLCLGFAGAGILIYAPLRLFCPPLLLYLGWRDLQAGYRALIQERQLNQAVFDSALVTVCLVRGYYAAGALRFCSQALEYDQLHKAYRAQEKRFRQLFRPNQLWQDDQPLNAQSQPPPLTWVDDESAAVQPATGAHDKNEIFIVNAGELLPCDGTVIAGQALVTQPWLDQTQATYKEQGAWVGAATLVQVGQLYIASERGHHTINHGYIQQLLEQAMITYRQHAVVQRQALTEQMALPFLGMTTLATLLWGPLAGSGVMAAWSGCDTSALTTLALLTLLTKAAQQGILIQDVCALEQLIAIDTLALDSTITQRPEAQSVLTALRNTYTVTLGQALQAEHVSCFVTASRQEAGLMDKAQVVIYLNNAQDQPCALPSATTAQVVLLDGALEQLQVLFALVHEFHAVTRKLTRKRTILSALSITGAISGCTGLITTVLTNHSSFWLSLHDSSTWGARLHPISISPIQKGTKTHDYDTQEQ